MKRDEKNNELEAQVKTVLDEYVTGTLRLNGRIPTAAWIAEQVNDRWNVKSSPGAVHNVMVKWEKMGFIVFARGGERPVAFKAYTDEARTIGLTQLKIRYFKEQKKQRAAAKKEKIDHGK